MQRNPSQTEVRSIFSDTYTFYTKWIAVKEPDWSEVIADSRAIEQKYNCELCCKILIELIAAIETAYMQAKGGL